MSENAQERTYYSEEAEQREQRKKTVLAVFSGTLGAAFGAAVGALTGIFFAPRKGEDTRQLVVEQVGQTVEGGRDAANQAVEKGISSLRQSSQELQSNVAEKVERVVEQGRNAVTEKVQKLRGTAADVKDDASKVHVPLTED